MIPESKQPLLYYCGAYLLIYKFTPKNRDDSYDMCRFTEIIN